MMHYLETWKTAYKQRDKEVTFFIPGVTEMESRFIDRSRDLWKGFIRYHFKSYYILQRVL